jgi:hypothetical protein
MKHEPVTIDQQPQPIGVRVIRSVHLNVEVANDMERPLLSGDTI